MRLPTVALFAKEPRPGRVKTRLAAATSPAWACRVATAFLRDTAARLGRLDVARVVAYTPDDARGYFASLGPGFTPIPQGDGDLGRRMAGYLRRHFEHDAGPAVLLGADSPTLPLDYVEQAFRDLARADVVLGPATDGGYYLLGCTRLVPELFHGVSWGGPRVLEETVCRLPGDCRLALLPPWYDVDTLDDWQTLRGHVAALRRAGLDPGIPHTEALLEETP